MLPSVSQGIVVVSTAHADRVALGAIWPEGCEPEPELVEAARQALTQRVTVVQQGGDEEPATRVSCPVIVDGRPYAAVAFRMDDTVDDPRRVVAPLVEAGAGLLGLLMFQAVGQQEAAVSATGLLARAFSQERLRSIALSAATDLASQLGCDRVSLGLREGEGVRLEAISGAAELRQRSDLAQRIEAAMREALEAKGFVLYTPEGEDPATEVRAHACLASESGAAQVLSVPLVHRGGAVGVLTFERSSQPCFDPTLVAFVEGVAAVLAPFLELRRRGEASWRRRCREALARGVSRLRDPSGRRPRMALSCGLALFALLLFARGEYRVRATATLEGEVHRAVVAPFDGYVESALASAGDLVQAGELLATLQQRDLDLEHEKRSRERDELGRLYDRALAQLDHSELRVLTARKAQADLKLQLLDERRARTQLTAPFDGVVVAGDLSRSLGAPVERGQVLFEVAPLEGYRVILQVDERDVAQVASEQSGRLVLAALPGERFDLTVEKVTPVAQILDGRNVFRVEARLGGSETALRPGMEGVGKIGVGRRRFLWIWTHGLVDWLRLQLWSWRP
jgi:multidrug resistance efflux pump